MDERRLYLTEIRERSGNELGARLSVYRVVKGEQEWLELESDYYIEPLVLELADLNLDICGRGILRVRSDRIVFGIGTTQAELARLRYVLENGGEPPRPASERFAPPRRSPAFAS